MLSGSATVGLLPPADGVPVKRSGISRNIRKRFLVAYRALDMLQMKCTE